jgi:tetratricopeptide (TPR) repeat protein
MGPGHPPHQYTPTTSTEFAQSITRTTERLIHLDRDLGAGAAAPVAREAMAGLREAWRRNRPKEPLPGSEMCAAAAELAEVAGWILFDAERQRQAYACNRQALALARRCGDRSTEGLVLSHLSMQAAHLGKPRASFGIAAAALDSGTLPPRVEAIFRVRQARALAMADRRQEALDAFDHARSLFADGVSSRDPQWAWWIDSQELDGHHGLTHAELGQWDEAAALLRSALEAPDAPPYRALFAAELLSVLVHAGAWREAEQTAAQLVTGVSGNASMRAVSTLKRAVTAMHRTPGVPPSLRDTAHCLGTRLSGHPQRTGPGTSQ